MLSRCGFSSETSRIGCLNLTVPLFITFHEPPHTPRTPEPQKYSNKSTDKDYAKGQARPGTLLWQCLKLRCNCVFLVTSSIRCRMVGGCGLGWYSLGSRASNNFVHIGMGGTIIMILLNKEADIFDIGTSTIFRTKGARAQRGGAPGFRSHPSRYRWGAHRYPQ